MPRDIVIPQPIEDYVLEHTREDALARRLREETLQLPQGGMQTGADQVALLALLVRCLGARRAIEIGTFTGYSALAIARALPADGQLVCCDVSEAWTQIARRYWKEAGIAERIELRLGPAIETLARLREETGHPFDFAYIDADKAGYDAYYEGCLDLLRPGGIIALDNMLWSGRVIDPAPGDADSAALSRLNAKIHGDQRVAPVLLTVGDGLMLAQKR
ncbi:O-methyltransferase [Dokdonella sp.]|uniref:O-methyltransferase n=1 Tax=Dokdonella sp. TaxID=2291710 RepID=UPI0031BE3D99|nr:class I SAM-dependent methyltransferase [Dokdonella sp.]